jgi:hypothetical protein
MIEYVFWGKPHNSDDDTLLLAMVEGLPITDRQSIDGYKKQLAGFGCRDVRVQEIHFTEEAARKLFAA